MSWWSAQGWSKVEASGRRVQETYTAVILKNEDVFGARHAVRVGAQRSRKTGGMAAVASQKWSDVPTADSPEKRPSWPKVARDMQAYGGTWFTLPAQITDRRLVEVWKQYPRDAAAREVAGSQSRHLEGRLVTEGPRARVRGKS